MKKIMNRPQDYAAEALAGFALAHADIVKLAASGDYLYRRQPKAEPLVAIISGGGSGHEPLHCGYVGYGMLDAAVCGPVFTSPTPEPILAATREVAREAGVLYLVKNYTGDVLNFEIAAELAELEGITVKTVIIDDDVAVNDSTYTAGRRGVAGTVLVEKIVGAAAESGASLEELVTLATEVNNSLASMGAALQSCTVPHIGEPTFELAAGEIEFGVGIHGEPGRARMELPTAEQLAGKLVEPLISQLKLSAGERVIALVNSLGATAESELFILYRQLREILRQRDIIVARSLVGSYVTSLDMKGASITLLRVTPDWLSLYDRPVQTATLRKDS